MRGAPLVLVALALVECGGSRVVGLIHARAVLGAASSNPPTLEVVARSIPVPDPLPVRGSDIAYADLDSALTLAVYDATSQWAASRRDHPVAKNGGWTVLLEVIGADAELDPGDRVAVSIDARATLKARSGNVYLGQTQLGCRERGPLTPEQGAAVAERCLARIGRDLASWLSGGVTLEPPPSERGP
jgi:hypothetical protein